MTKEVKKLLTTIFSDADIVDIDFCHWDKYISIVVIADHLSSAFDKSRRPIFKLNFWGVEEINFQFRHHIKNTILTDKNKHFQWVVDQSEISKNGEKYILEFYQTGSMSFCVLKFEKVSVVEISHKYFDKVTPGWNEPYTPLARGSIMEIYNKMVGGRLKD